MTHRIGHLSRFAPYGEEAERVGFRELLLFTPHDIRNKHNCVYAHSYRNGRWQPKRARPLPDIAHDIGFYSKPSTICAVKRAKDRSGIPFLGYGLGNKWTIHQKLSDSPFLPFLPETVLYKDTSTVLAMVSRHSAVMIKPKNGKRGVGIVRVAQDPSNESLYDWKTGSQASVRLNRRQLSARLRNRFPKEAAVVQRWMDIREPDARVFDLRALMQKKSSDEWEMTALGVRRAAVGRIASNVFGGGEVADAAAFLTNLYGKTKAEELLAGCANIANELPVFLEKSYGKPFIELGIDLAVERGGLLQIIEVNIKPGKKIVRALSGEKAYADAVTAPVRYAYASLSGRRDCPSKDL